MASYEHSGKGYVDRCVQTLPVVSVSEKAGEFAETRGGSYDKTCSEISYTNADDSRDQLNSCLNSAYSQSLAVNSPSGPVRSPGLSRRHRQQQMIYSRPTELKTVKRRFVSLPENSPRTVELGALRIVSMPDRPTPTLSNPDLSTEIFEYSSSSGAEMSQNSVADISVYRRHSGYPRDIPRTPSPPSSPDSIIVIGNNAQVPLSFLGQKCDSRELYSDDNGWVTWASSPPRPIPALHGPLSLPYARCPSGAEGTLAEGEDLSHMIWGLGIDDSHAQKHRSSGPSLLSNGASRQQKPQLQLSRDFLPRLSQTRDPIDISRASILRDQVPGNKAVNQQQAPAIYQYSFPSDSYISCLSTNPLHYTYLDQQDDEKDILGSNLPWQCGLGLHLDWVPPGQDEQRKPPATLKTPTFVPSRRTPLGFIKSKNSLSTTQTLQRLSAFEIAHQYQAKQQMQASLPTPPSSSSPQWSPYLHQSIEYTSPALTQSHLPSNRDISWLLQQPGYQALESSHIVRKPNVEQPGNRGSSLAPIDLNTLFLRATKPTLDHGEQLKLEPSRTTLDDPLGYLERPPNTDLPATPRNDNTKPDLITKVRTGPVLSPTSPIPMENRRHLSQQQPRSIPLARLIQRRLSSVTEEECGAHESSEGQNQTSSNRPQESKSSKPHFVRTHRPQKNTTLITQSRNELELNSAARNLVPLETKPIVKLPPKVGTKISEGQPQNWKMENQNDKAKDGKTRKIGQKKLRKQKNSSIPSNV